MVPFPKIGDRWSHLRSSPKRTDPAFVLAISKATALCMQVASDLGDSEVADLQRLLTIADPLEQLHALRTWSVALLNDSHAARLRLN